MSEAVTQLDQKYPTQVPEQQWSRNASFLHQAELPGEAYKRLRYDHSPTYRRVSKDRDYVTAFLNAMPGQPRYSELVLAAAYTTEHRLRSAMKGTDYLVKIMP